MLSIVVRSLLSLTKMATLVVEDSEEQNVAKAGESVHGVLSQLLQRLSAIEESQHEILHKLDLVHAAGAHSKGGTERSRSDKGKGKQAFKTEVAEINTVEINHANHPEKPTVLVVSPRPVSYFSQPSPRSKRLDESTSSSRSKKIDVQDTLSVSTDACTPELPNVSKCPSQWSSMLSLVPQDERKSRSASQLLYSICAYNTDICVVSCGIYHGYRPEGDIRGICHRIRRRYPCY